MHIIKSAPIVLLPKQPPLLVWLLSLGRDSAPRCWSISLCNSKAEKQPWGDGKQACSALIVRLLVVLNELQITEARMAVWR